VRIVNDPAALGLQLENAGSNTEVVLEATCGWYRVVDVLQAAGALVHLAHPLGVKGFRYRRVTDHPRRTSANNQLLVRILQDRDYRVKAFDASQIQRIDQIGAAGELSEAAMRLRQPCGSGQAGARAFRALQAHLRFAAYPR
jgi:hypothetical protein